MTRKSQDYTATYGTMRQRHRDTCQLTRHIYKPEHDKQSNQAVRVYNIFHAIQLNLRFQLFIKDKMVKIKDLSGFKT